MPSVPTSLRTGRLHLRRWQPQDAAALLPLLQANVTHLRGWIPRHVSEPAPLHALSRRLTDFAANFDADREWRFAMLTVADGTLLGEVDLFPRSASGRVQLAAADRLEIGYWLRADYTGRGFATEATRALIDLARTLPGMIQVEIRCDARNLRSAAVPQRLGFELVPPPTDAAGDEAAHHDMLWYLALSEQRR